MPPGYPGGGVANPDGVSWEDQQWQSTQSGVHPSMSGLLHGNSNNVNNNNGSSRFKKSGSSKSLHQDQFWNSNPMWSAAPPGSFNPMFNPWGNPMINPMNNMNSMHR